MHSLIKYKQSQICRGNVAVVTQNLPEVPAVGFLYPNKKLLVMTPHFLPVTGAGQDKRSLRALKFSLLLYRG